MKSVNVQLSLLYYKRYIYQYHSFSFIRALCVQGSIEYLVLKMFCFCLVLTNIDSMYNMTSGVTRFLLKEIQEWLCLILLLSELKIVLVM